MKMIAQRYKSCFIDRSFLYSFFLSAVFLVLSIVVDFYATAYATISASSPVTDIVLSNTRTFDIDGFFVIGAMLLVLFIIIICLIEPQKIPFTLESIALFVLIRSVFITLTHIGPFPTAVVLDKSTLHVAKEIIGRKMSDAVFTGNDLFFSGHTGLPFLMAFVSWDNKWLRYIFIVLSIAFGIAVLLGHLHYSIDVLAAFFITASIFELAKRFFKKDYERSLEKCSLPNNPL